MRIAVIAFSAAGAALAARIAAAGDAYWRADGGTCEFMGYIARRQADRLTENGELPVFDLTFEPFDSVYEIAARLFHEADALVFVGACGIAVRAVAPLVASKLTDPAVVVCDETGRFAVSLLSGHAGGANRLAEQIAAAVGATPVITTASDAKAAQSGLPQPKNLVLGIGCRRGLPAETIERAATIMLWDEKIPLARVAEIATIDVKRDEAGLLGFARAHGIPLRLFSAAELAAVEGEFTGSERVLRAVGVDNVCERAATLCGRNGSTVLSSSSGGSTVLSSSSGGSTVLSSSSDGALIMRKTAMRGVTVAIFERSAPLPETPPVSGFPCR